MISGKWLLDQSSVSLLVKKKKGEKSQTSFTVMFLDPEERMQTKSGCSIDTTVHILLTTMAMGPGLQWWWWQGQTVSHNDGTQVMKMGTAVLVVQIVMMMTWLCAKWAWDWCDMKRIFFRALCFMLPLHYKKKKDDQGWWWSSVAEHLLRTCKALCLTPSIAKRGRKKKRHRWSINNYSSKINFRTQSTSRFESFIHQLLTECLLCAQSY